MFILFERVRSRGNNFEHLPQSISKLGALQLLYLTNCKRLTQLPEDIGSLSSLEKLRLSGNNFEHLPQSISELGALISLELSDCKRLTRTEDIGCLSSLKELHLCGNNFEHLPQSISKLGALQLLYLTNCKKTLDPYPLWKSCVSVEIILSICLKAYPNLVLLYRWNYQIARDLHSCQKTLDHIRTWCSYIVGIIDCKETYTYRCNFHKELDIIDLDWSNDLISEFVFP
ncbi:hypothetical protein H5410_054392 [Solanum commersonii]|uniref:Disease resistance R13L4/SHOC-2-like LRR domain-containing protein n=1 Tax=Solanum commersonii TaxID=4109 RepID=A0A9J5WF71_SOLCO|nr:hypothetical protein H5410_054392 [Solanum commersonii]